MQNLHCKHIGKCGGCTINAPYNAQLKSKKQYILSLFSDELAKSNFTPKDLEVFASPPTHYRARAEFRIFRENVAIITKQTQDQTNSPYTPQNKKPTITLAMMGKDNEHKKAIKIPIKSCPILLPNISVTLSSFVDFINDLALCHNKEDFEILSHKLYAIEALGIINPPKNTAPKSNQNLSVILTLIYHKKLESKWEKTITNLAQKLPPNIAIIGRSKHQKIILQTDSLLESITLTNLQKTPFKNANQNTKKYDINKQQHLIFLRSEGRFSQPNAFINPQMISFVKSAIFKHSKEDLLEMYCGEGNFCVSLARDFRKVLATEVVKSAIPALQINAKNNGIENITALRLSGEESIEALEGKREFFRAREVDLRSFRFSHILIDPPRSGISGSEISGDGISGSEISGGGINKNEISESGDSTNYVSEICKNVVRKNAISGGEISKSEIARSEISKESINESKTNKIHTSQHNPKHQQDTNISNASNTHKQRALKMLDFIATHRYIIYISCNPLSLKKDLEILLKNHKITHFALFDQFPHTHHIESALILEKR